VRENEGGVVGGCDISFGSGGMVVVKQKNDDWGDGPFGERVRE